MNYSFSSSGTGEPVTLAEAKAQMRVLHATEDDLITRLIAAASRHIESRTGRSLVKRTFTYQCDGFPACGGIGLPRPPVIAIASVAYVDESGATRTLDAARYQLVMGPLECEIVPTVGGAWPATSRARRSVTVTYTAGYGDDSTAVPQDIRNAILMLIQHWYDHRSAVTEGSAVVTPFAVEALIGPYMMTGWI